jgi:hypothetical protein
VTLGRLQGSDESFVIWRSSLLNIVILLQGRDIDCQKCYWHVSVTANDQLLFLTTWYTRYDEHLFSFACT